MITKTILSNHEEWLKNRKNGIGGSEIAAVIGKNPYMTNVELWELKTGRKEAKDISNLPYIKYGTQAEPLLRELFRLDFPEYQVRYEENNSFRNDKYPWAQASVDGWLFDGDGRLGIWECKTTNILNGNMRKRWDHQIPDHYYCQCLLYMAVLEADFCELKAQLKSEYAGEVFVQTKHYHFERKDVKEDMEYLIKEGKRFWGYVERDECPPLILPDVIRR